MRCRNCFKEFNKNNPNQIVHFCSKACRKAFRHPDRKAIKLALLQAGKA